MLIEFRVQNHRSIRSEQVFTMEAGGGGDAADRRARAAPGHRTPILTAAAIYGANASGKSNVLSALGLAREAVIGSHRRWAPDGGIPRDPFAWCGGVSEPSMFEITAVHHGVRYQYGFVVDDDRFLEEWLYAWPKKRKQIWFEREGDSFKFGDHLQGENRVVEQITRPNSLFLSAAIQNRHEQLRPLYQWFLQLRLVNVAHRHRRLHDVHLNHWLRRAMEDSTSKSGQRDLFQDTEAGTRNQRFGSLLALLRAADIGIVDLKFVDEDDKGSHGRSAPYAGRILVRHRSDAEEAWLPLEEESQGTRTLLRIGPALVDALRLGGVLVVDELESSLHPLLALQMVRRFNDPDANPNNAQIVFSTHDTNLLGTTAGDPPLRRDQVWLTEKDEDGGTSLYPLTEFKPRKQENLERGYLQGRYGAIPFLGGITVNQE